MSLDARLKPPSGTPARASQPDAAPALAPDIYYGLKAQLHTRVVDRLDLETLSRLTPEQLTQELTGILARMVTDTNLPLNRREREKMVHELIDDILGLGPLEALMRDTAISDILVNTFGTIYVERGGRLELTPLRFRDNEHLQQTINRIVSRVGRRVDETSPMVDARLPDGSRVNAIIPPLAVDGPILSIRRFGGAPLRTDDLVRTGAMTAAMRSFLEACVKSKFNVLVAGGTGTGKTTMLNALSSFIPNYERIVTIEDAAELQLQQSHVVRLETRPPNVEGKGEVLTRDLVRNSLRMRPDRIIVGEIRSVEILDMLQAMNTGHEGSMATLHANSSRDALTRMMAMIGMSGLNVTEQVVSQMIARALDLIVQLQRGGDGKRRIVAISEVTGTEGTTIQMQDIFVFRQRGVDAEGRAVGDFFSTGIRPRCAERLERAGFNLPPEIFTPMDNRQVRR
ncbi:CpaF family protein [Pendulispora rubella]|uniref:CpaF family protein n=1 Tax=Pendulispora rubella TaxID=2741070 RepID=A0ABZ2KSQ0_9BACT